MSRPQDILLRRLCPKPETLTKAQVILHTAAAKTGPGSGYELGQGAPGLPAICAYIAAQELGDSDVSEQVAQGASCLAPKIFKTTLSVVRSALTASASRTRRSASALKYETLIQKNKIGRKAFVESCMRDVEKALVASRELPDELRPPCDIVTLCVFGWTCTKALDITKIRPELLVKEYGISRRDYEDVEDILESTCQDVLQNIKQRVSELAKQVTARRGRSSAPTPVKGTSPTKSPSKSALKGTDVEASPTKTPTRKRKVVFAESLESDGMDVLQTPSKRPKVSSPLKSSAVTTPQRTGLAGRPSPAKRAFFPKIAAPPESAPHLLQDGDDEESEPETQFAAAHFAPSDTPSTPIAGPSTPRRSLSHATSQGTNEPDTPTSATQSRKQMSRAPLLLEDAEPLRRRRFRPVFLDQSQWLQRDPQAEREWKAAEAFRRSMAEERAYALADSGQTPNTEVIG
ncbi:hypothetical protein AcV7_009676 [Taiwanofungus camphoratus]|nr:hypothetical protein AcV7_009676 [Antrodia cinnamomea]